MARRSQPSLDKFNDADEYGAVYSASLQIVLYTNQRLPELAEGVSTCYRLFLDRFGDDVDRYSARSMRQARAFSAKYADVFPTLCQEQGEGLPRFAAFHGKQKLDYRPPVFQTWQYDGFSWLQLHLPPDSAKDRDGVLHWVSTLADAFPFRCGTVGFSLCWYEDAAARDAIVPKLIAPLYKRYPGFALGTPGDISDHPLPPVNWLTLLGPELVEKLGGVRQVSSDLGDDVISVTPMGAGICIRAGEAPQIGDRNRGDDVPAYRKVGAYLKDYRGDEYLDLPGFEDDDDTAAWLARFDD